MKVSVIVEHKPYMLLNTIYRLGFKLVEISNNIYPRNHPNYLSDRFFSKYINENLKKV